MKKQTIDPFKDTVFSGQKIQLDNKQCAQVEAKVKEAGGELQFLHKVGAIRIRDERDKPYDYGFVVLRYSDCKGRKAAWNYLYDSEFPYQFWSEVLDQMKAYVRRREFAKEKEVEQLQAKLNNKPKTK